MLSTRTQFSTAEYAAWLAEVLAGSEEFALLDTVLSGFVRTMTHPKIMPKPAPPGLALESVRAIIGAPSARWLPASVSLWTAFEKLVEGDGAIKGNLVPDAFIAAAAIAHGARLATADRGFARFPGLNWFDPVAREHPPRQRS